VIIVLMAAMVSVSGKNVSIPCERNVSIRVGPAGPRAPITNVGVKATIASMFGSEKPPTVGSFCASAGRSQ